MNATLTEIHHVALRVCNTDAAMLGLGDLGFKFETVEARHDFTLLKFRNVFLALLGPTYPGHPHVGVDSGIDFCGEGGFTGADTSVQHRDGSRGFYNNVHGLVVERLSDVPPALSLNDTKTVLEIFSFDGGRPAFTLHVGTNLLSWSDSKNDPEWEQRLQSARSLVSRAGGEIRDLRKSQQ